MGCLHADGRGENFKNWNLPAIVILWEEKQGISSKHHSNQQAMGPSLWFKSKRISSQSFTAKNKNKKPMLWLENSWLQFLVMQMVLIDFIELDTTNNSLLHCKPQNLKQVRIEVQKWNYVGFHHLILFTILSYSFGAIQFSPFPII